MKGKRVLLHAGFAKTGTTAIQVALATAREELARQGIVYPVCQMEGLTHRDSHPAVSFAHLRRQLNYRRVVDPREARTWLNDVLAAFMDSSDHLLILSHETLGEAARRIRWRTLRTSLQAFEVAVVVYVRVLDEFIESRLEQSLRSGFHSARDLRRQASHLRPSRLSYLARLGKIERGLRAPVQVLSYDAVRKTDSLLDSFAAAAGIRNSGAFDALSRTRLQRNISLAGAHRLFLMHASGPRLASQVRGELVRVFRTRPPTVPENMAVRRFGLLEPQLKAKARQLFNREVPEINLRFGCHLEPARELERSDLDYATRLTPDEFANIADTLEGTMSPDSLTMVRKAYER